MKTTIKIPATIVVIIGALLMACSKQKSPEEAASSQSADTIYLNGKIYTVNDKKPWAEAVAIKDGKFIAVGKNTEIEALKGDATKVVDLGGKLVMPGLIDSHVHPLGVANSWANLRLENATDEKAMLAEIKAYAEANPDLPMIRGEAWNLGVFEKDSPKKELLDAIDSKRPIYLQSQTGHSAWANSKALEMAGITKDTPNGGAFIFDVDPKTGEPTGTVREFAMGAVEQALPGTATENYQPALKRVIELFSSYGFTSLKCAEGTKDWIAGAAALDRSGALEARLFPCWEWRSHYTPHNKEDQDALPLTWETYHTDHVYPRHVKMFYDGAPDSHTALLLEDYSDRAGFKAQSNLPKEEFLEAIADFNKKGLGVMVHVLGDGGAQEVVDIFIEVRKRNGDNGVPLHFSHGWMARADDVSKLAKVKDAMVDFSPALAYPAPEIEGSMAPPIGEERYQKWFNVRSIIESGVPVGFGSDWASALIPEPNGFHQMQAWIQRRDPANPEGRTLNAEQAISLEQAVHGFTLGGAEVLGFGWDKKVGSIEKGKLADLIVLDRNIFEHAIKDLYKTKVILTVLNGNVIFDRKEELAELALVKVEVTNPDLKNAIDTAELNLLVADELAVGGKKCCGATHTIIAGSRRAPAEINQAFAELEKQGHRYVRPARTVYWKKTDASYWIQWSLKDDVAVLFAYDPELKKAVEVLRVKEKSSVN